MGQKKLSSGFTPQEHRISALPSTLAAILIFLITLYTGFVTSPQDRGNLGAYLGIGALGLAYLVAFNFFFIPSAHYEVRYAWINAVVTGLGLALFTYFTPDRLDFYLGVLLVILVVSSALIAERGPAYLLIAIVTLATVIIRRAQILNVGDWTLHLNLTIIAIIMLETIQQLKRLSRGHIRRLETITDFSRAIASTLETRQVTTLLSAALQNTVDADGYFVGFRDGDDLRLDLIYDDGEYYDNQRFKLEGSLSGWVIKNQQTLFLPDMRKEVDLPSVRIVLVGRHKTSLSWIGVPIRGIDVDGIMAISAYRPNAFSQADLELLINLASYAVQALDNSYRHGQVEEQTRLDSLTNVYNHGYFLELLRKQVDEAAAAGQPLSVIMLDIDYFKQYNDSYGHLAGDEILTNLCKIIKSHIKHTDAVGRWGGEEFAISLPGANAEQTQLVAERIRASMSKLLLRTLEQDTIPVPTISQGIAIFPFETREAIKLIDLADKRLYVAKERGRNQIEPEASYWAKLREEIPE
jgi:diguanylate cyclase (GGDEF)-like protein